MGILSVQEVGTGRTFSINEKNERTYKKLFKVETDDPTTDQYTVANAVGIPLGAAYTSATYTDTFAFCKGVSADCISPDGRQWIVNVEYGKWDTPDPNPLNQAPKVNWSFQQFTRTVLRDVNGTPILNSAGDPFDPIEIDDSRPVLSVVRNEAGYNPLLAAQYKDAINADSFYGCSPGQVKVMDIGASYEINQDYGNYWTVSYQFAFNLDGWEHKILDRGVREIKNNKPVNIVISGSPVSEPVLLNGRGRQLPQGGQPVYKTFTCYKKIPFAIFGI